MSLRDAFLDYRGYNIVRDHLSARAEHGHKAFKDRRDDRIRAEYTMTIEQCRRWQDWLFDTSDHPANRFTLEAIISWYPRCPEKFDAES